MAHIPLYFLQESVMTRKSNPSYSPKLSTTLLEAMKYEISKGNYTEDGTFIEVTPRVQMTQEEMTSMINYFEQQHIYCQQLVTESSVTCLIKCRFLGKY